MLEDEVRKLVALLMSDRDERLWVEDLDGEVGKAWRGVGAV